jgi:4-amino-4-deoxy-L-arabinose transferase-like glycosyltransferase
LVAVLIFYSSLVVGWESITAYVDLARTFFEVLAFWGFLNWFESKSTKWLVISGVMMSFAITSKLVAVASLPVFLLLFAYEAYSKKERILLVVKRVFVFVFFAFLIPLPWFMFSFINTGNPFYPYFSNIPVDSGQSLVIPDLLFIFRDFYNLFLNLSDPISPLYLLLLPLIIVVLKKADLKVKFLALYTFSAIIIWYLTQEARGGRFIMPYLPVFAVLAAYAVGKIKNKKIEAVAIIVVVIVSLSSILYRDLANKKFIPVLLGRESKSQFLTNNLNFSFGDFYDTDGYFAKTIKSSDKVLLFGFHNLYYVNFPFIDSSFIKKGDKFNYIAVQDSGIPARFSNWKEIYYNKTTHVKLYTKEGKEWVY